MNRALRFTCGVRRFCIAIPLFLLVIVTTPLHAQSSSLLERLPANTVFFAHWRGMASVTSAEKTNHVVQLFEDPQFAPAREALLKNLRSNIAKNGPATSEPELAEVLSLLDNSAVLGVVLNPGSGTKPAADAAAPPATGLFIVYDAHAKTALVEKLRAANRAKGKEVPTVMSYVFQGTKIEARATGTDVSYTALTPKYYFLADQKPVIEDLISRYGAADKPADSVTQLPEYQQIRPYVNPDAAVEFFARVPNLSKILTAEQLAKPGAKFAENLHVDRVHVAGGSVSFAGEAVRFRGAMLGDASKGTIFDFAGASTPSFITLPVVGPGPIFSISRYDLAASYQLVRTAAQPFLTPQQEAAVEMYEKMAQGFLGMSVPDALQLLTGEISSETAFAEDGSSMKTFALSIQKPQDILRILRAVAGGFIVSEDTAGDTTYLDLSFPSTDPKTGEKRRDLYYVAVMPDMIVAAPRKAAARAIVERLNAKAGASTASGVLANPDFLKTRASFPEKLSGLTVADLSGIPWDQMMAHNRQQLAEAAKNLPPDNAPQTDWFSAIPPPVLTRHLKIGILGWWKDANGIYFDSYVQ